jgi:hypothetical protein
VAMLIKSVFSFNMITVPWGRGRLGQNSLTVCKIDETKRQ